MRSKPPSCSRRGRAADALCGATHDATHPVMHHAPCTALHQAMHHATQCAPPCHGARAARRAAPERPRPRAQGTGVTSLTRKQADARCERGDDRLAPLEQVASDEHGRRAKVAAG
eukprot:scaffold34415_cov64-Phaeocystis_antarctica.AAC.1